MTSPDVMAALRLMEGGRLREAALKLKRLREGHPDAADVLQAEAMVAMRRGDFVTAENACAAWEHCMPSQPLPKARLGTAQLHQGRFDDARSTLDQALATA
jgi:Flp pilus assembly protein TadD